jgi:hypothetical protein
LIYIHDAFGEEVVDRSINKASKSLKPTRFMALKESVQDEQKQFINQQVFLKNGVKVNIEYLNEISFIGQIIKGNDKYQKHTIVESVENDRDKNNTAKILEFKTRPIQ